MKVSYNELNTRYFDGNLPSPETLAEAVTFHAWEIESIEIVGDDTVLDVKVLPDKSAWALSHHGVAKDISIILNIPLVTNVLVQNIELEPKTEEIVLTIESTTCDRYTVALIKGVRVSESPLWLRNFLTSMGQRSINNIVDLTNYVMFSLGQPLHAFDARKITNKGTHHIGVRDAKEGECITTLTGETYTLTPEDALIVDWHADTPLGIAGIKGGKVAEVDNTTVDIILESAHFDAVHVRKTSQRLKLRTDASTRFESGVSASMAVYGLKECAERIVEHCGGHIVGYVDTNPVPIIRASIALTVLKVNSVLGLSLTMTDIEDILRRFGYVYQVAGDTVSVLPPHERTDLVIQEDLIEEIGRIYGLEHVPSIPIDPIPLREVNARFYHTEAVRDALVTEGFSEIFTSSFREHDVLKLKNALATGKGYLRSEKGIVESMKSALEKNAPNADLFGTDQIRVFEFGKVFDASGEREVLVVGVQSKQGYIVKKDKHVYDRVREVVAQLLPGVLYSGGDGKPLVFAFSGVLSTLMRPSRYAVHGTSPDVTYTPFSPYPYLTRDVAFWTEQSTSDVDAEGIVRESAGPLVERIDLFDRFEKEGKVSYGFRIVFQSHEKTLEGVEADVCMGHVYASLRARGWIVR
jgi:phenylalanyl-tRNA synthetase beta chain